MPNEPIQVKFSKEQTKALDVLDDKETLRALYGGQAGGGKSFLIAMWQIQRRMLYPETRGYIGRESLKDLKNSVLVTFFDCCRVLGLKDGLDYSYNDQKSFIDFENGSRIVLLDLAFYPSDPNFNALGSTEYTDGAIEEGVHVHKRCAELLLSRTRYKHDVYDLKPKQLITCNPSPGWIKDDIIVPYYAGTLEKKTKFIQATLDSNPNKKFVETYKETLSQMSDVYDKARLLHGDWFAQPRTGGEAYKDFVETRDVGPTVYKNEEPLHLTFDFNVKPYVTLNVWQITGKDCQQIDEICLPTPRNSTRSACQEFNIRYREHVGGVTIYGDPAGKHEDTRSERGQNDFYIIMQELERFRPSLRVASKAPAVAMRIEFINAIFARRFNGLSMVIDPKCTNTIQDYNFVKENPDRTKLKERIKDPATKVSFEKYGHTSDANDYFICEAFYQDFVEYQKGKTATSYTLGNKSLDPKTRW